MDRVYCKILNTKIITYHLCVPCRLALAKSNTHKTSIFHYYYYYVVMIMYIYV